MIHKKILIGAVLLFGTQGLTANNLLKPSMFSTDTISFSQLYGEHNYSPEVALFHLQTSIDNSSFSATNSQYNDKTKISSSHSGISAAGSYKFKYIPFRIGTFLSNSDGKTTHKKKSTSNTIYNDTQSSKFEGTIFLQSDVTSNISVSLSREQESRTIKDQNEEASYSTVNKEAGVVFHKDNSEIGINFTDISKVNSKIKDKTNDNLSYSEIHTTAPIYSLFGFYGVTDSLTLGGEYKAIQNHKTSKFQKNEHLTKISSKYLVTPKISLNTYYELRFQNESEFPFANSKIIYTRGDKNKIGLESNFNIGQAMKIGADFSYSQNTIRMKTVSNTYSDHSLEKNISNTFYGAIRGGYVF